MSKPILYARLDPVIHCDVLIIAKRCRISMAQATEAVWCMALGKDHEYAPLVRAELRAFREETPE